MKLTAKQYAMICVGLITILSLPLFMPLYYTGLLTQVLIYTIFATAVNLLLGYTGLPSIGHAAFFGIAAYTVGILTTHDYQNPWLNAWIGIFLATVVAGFFGLICVHCNGIRFLMITLALGKLAWGLAIKWSSVTGGEDGIVGIQPPETGFIFSLNDVTNFYYFSCLVTLVSLLILYLVVRSPFGLSLAGIREDEERMRALGYNIWLHKYISFVMSGLFCGIAGVLWVYQFTYVGLSSIDIMLSTNGLLMPILGGVSFFLGPALGALVIVIVENVISGLTQHWLFILGSMFIIVIVFVPNGILGGITAILGKKD